MVRGSRLTLKLRVSDVWQNFGAHKFLFLISFFGIIDFRIGFYGRLQESDGCTVSSQPTHSSSMSPEGCMFMFSAKHSEVAKTETFDPDVTLIRP